MTSALEGGVGTESRPGRFLAPEKTRYPLYRMMDGPQGRSGQVRKFSPLPGFVPRTVQPVAQALYRLSYRANFHSETASIISFISKNMVGLFISSKIKAYCAGLGVLQQAAPLHGSVKFGLQTPPMGDNLITCSCSTIYHSLIGAQSKMTCQSRNIMAEISSVCIRSKLFFFSWVFYTRVRRFVHSELSN